MWRKLKLRQRSGHKSIRAFEFELAKYSEDFVTRDGGECQDFDFELRLSHLPKGSMEFVENV